MTGQEAYSDLVDAGGQEAAIDGDALAGDEAGAIGGQQDGGADQLIGAAETGHGGAQLELAAAFGAIEERGVDVGAEDAAGDGVDVDAIAGPLDGEAAGEREDGGFRRGVGGDLDQGDERVERRYINNAAAAMSGERRVEGLAGAEHAGEVDVEETVPLEFGDLLGGFAEDLAGGIEEDIDLAELGQDGVAKGVDGFAGGDIAGVAESLAASLLDGGTHLFD